MDGMLTFTRAAYNEANVIVMIQPKVVREATSNGFFTSFGELIADHYTFAVITTLLMLIVAGPPDTPSAFKAGKRLRTASLYLNSKTRIEPLGQHSLRHPVLLRKVRFVVRLIMMSLKSTDSQITQWNADAVLFGDAAKFVHEFALRSYPSFVGGFRLSARGTLENE